MSCVLIISFSCAELRLRQSIGCIDDALVNWRFLAFCSRCPFSVAMILGRCLFMSWIINPDYVWRWCIQLNWRSVDGVGLKHDPESYYTNYALTWYTSMMSFAFVFAGGFILINSVFHSGISHKSLSFLLSVIMIWFFFIIQCVIWKDCDTVIITELHNVNEWTSTDCENISMWWCSW